MATITTPTTPTSWSPDLVSFAAEDIISDALVLETSTVAGAVEGDAVAVRVPYVDDATADFVAEGAEIPETTPELSEALVYTGKVSQLVRLSREQWSQDQTAERLAASAARSIIRRADAAYIAQAVPTAPNTNPPAGILNIPGIVPGGEVLDDLDPIVDLLAQLEANGAEPSHLVIGPAGWATLRKLKTGTGQATTLLGAGTADTERRLLDLPVLVRNAVPASTALVLDKSAIVSAVGELQVAVSTDRYFESDGVAVRSTFRFGANVVRPERIGWFTLGDES